MTIQDEDFINRILQKGKEAEEKVAASFSNLSTRQINWKPGPKSWSIAQCLDHLIISKRYYFPILEKITNNTYQMCNWEKYSPLSGLWGRLFIRMVQEHSGIRIPAPEMLSPEQSDFSTGIINEYGHNLSTMLQYISKCRTTDIQHVIITSPVSGIITCTLKDIFQLQLQHDHRHINQAIRVKENPSFPKD